MLIGLVLAAIVGVAAGVTGTWSPCGLSSVSTLGTGLRDRRGRGRTLAATAAFTVAAMAGGCLTFGGAALAGRALGLDGDPALAGVAAALALACGVADLRFLPVVPQIPRQVPERVRWHVPLPLTGALYGLLLGLGFTTYLLTYAMWAMAGACLLLGSPLLGAVVGLAFGAGRALPVLLLVGSYESAGTQRFLDDLERRPLLLVGMRRINGAVLLLAAAVLVPTAFAGAAVGTYRARAWDPVAAGRSVVFERGAASVLERGGRSAVTLPGRDAAVGGGRVAWQAGDDVTVADASTQAPLATRTITRAGALAVDADWLVARRDTPRSNVLVASSLANGEEATGTLYTVRSPAQISRPSLRGGRVVFGVSRPTGSRIEAIDLPDGHPATLRTAGRRTTLTNPSIDGGRLLFVRTDRCYQSLVLGPIGKARKDRVVLRLRSTSPRDGGFQPGYVDHYDAASRCPHKHVSAQRGVLWSTALVGRVAYVTLLAGSRADRPSILRVAV